MFDTSKDILFLTISICVAVFTIFFCWGMYYFIAMVRNVFKVTDDARNILKKTEEAIDLVKMKISESVSYVMLFGEALKKVVDFAKDFSEKKRERKEEEEKAEEEVILKAKSKRK